MYLHNIFYFLKLFKKKLELPQIFVYGNFLEKIRSIAYLFIAWAAGTCVTNPFMHNQTIGGAFNFIFEKCSTLKFI